MTMTIEFPTDTAAIAILDERAEFLRGRNVVVGHSQFGEDGLIQAALERIGETNRWCFEVGAGDGLENSNTSFLIARGWRSVQIEAHDGRFGKLIALHYGNPDVACVRATVGAGDIDRILSEHAAPTAPDVGVIDVDGPDYQVWSGMTEYRPRLMLVEYAPEHYQNDQAKGAQIIELGQAKGYGPLAATYCNILFCLEGVLQ